MSNINKEKNIQSNNKDEPIITQKPTARPYENSYIQDSFSLDLTDKNRENCYFWPDEPISIKIVGYEEEPTSLVLLHTNVYIINIQHCNHTWQIKRRYKNFLRLYETYCLFKTKLNIRSVAAAASAHHFTTNYLTLTSMSNPIRTNKISSSNNPTSKFKPADHFKLIFKAIGSDFDQAKLILEKFLQEAVDHQQFRYHNETLKFLEVSHLSFINDLGKKNKEGLIKKRSFNMNCLNLFWDSRWLCVKDSYIAQTCPRTGRINCVLLVDQGFKVLSGQSQTGIKKGLYIENLSKSLFIKCCNEKRAHEWYLSILNMLYTTSQPFIKNHPFQSYAPLRTETLVKWFIDGSDYMESVADALDSAQSEIFLTGFFLSPEIYLKRPAIMGDKWRLDKILKRKAEQGVKIYILIYKEIEITLPFNSAYAKRVFALSHKNIKVLRHPDHINEPNKFFTIMWAHHEKLVIIDQSVAFFGGLDLCYGRWDNHSHKLTDLGSVLCSNSGSTNSSKQKEHEFTPISNLKLDMEPTASKHFLSAVNNTSFSTSNMLNLSCSDSYLNDTYNNIPIDLNNNNISKSLDDIFNCTNNEFMAKSSTMKNENDKKIGIYEKFKNKFNKNDDTIFENGEYVIPSIGKRILTNLKQKIKLSDTSEIINSSFDDKDSISINSFSSLQGSAKYWIGKDYCNFIIKDVRDVHAPFEDAIDRTNTPRIPWHDVGGCVCGSAARDMARHFIQRWNYTKSKKVKNNHSYPLLMPKSYESYSIPRVILNNFSLCNVQVLRSVSTWSAGINRTEKSIHEAMKHLIRTAKHYIYIENQFFISNIDEHPNSLIRNEIVSCLFERIFTAAKLRENFKVYVFLPLMPGYEGEYGKASAVTLHSITHFNNSSINGLIKKLSDSGIEALNYICFFSLRTWSELNGKLITEMIYIHSKMMIIDDRACIIGSANINDRSLMGNRDSEIACLVEDTNFVDGCLNRQSTQVGVFTSKLRKKLFKEFLGLLNCDETNHDELIDVSDPCSDEFYKNIMIKYAAQNTRIYDLVSVFKLLKLFNY
jgi:phospholipase D1/2